MEIRLIDYCGEFCTERTNPGIPKILDLIMDAILKDEEIRISRKNIKIMTTSFIDEISYPVMLKHSKEIFLKHVIFSPPLEQIYLKQLDRGLSLRQ